MFDQSLPPAFFKGIFYSAAIFFLFISDLPCAQVEPVNVVTATTSVLTLDECISLALKNSSNIDQAGKRVSAETALTSQVKSKLGPSLDGEANYVRAEGPASGSLDFNVVRVVFTQPLYQGGALEGVNRQAATKLAAQSKYDDAVIDVTFATKRAYFEILKSLHVRDVMDRYVRELRSLLEKTRQRQKAGSVIGRDVLLVESELSRRVRSLEKVENGTAFWMAKLNVLLGRLPLVETKLTQIELDPPALQTTMDDSVRLAQAGHPLVKSAEALLLKSRSSLRMAAARRRPTLDLSGSYGYSGSRWSSLERDWRAGVSAIVPIWHSGEFVHEVQRARAEDEEAAALLKEVKDEVSATAIEAYSDAHQAQLMRAGASLQKEAGDEGLRVARALYDEGSVTTKDLLEALRDQIDAQRENEESLYDLYTAMARLDWAIGTKR